MEITKPRLTTLYIVCAVLSILIAPPEIYAQNFDDEETRTSTLKELRLIVPDVRGPRAFGRNPMTQTLRKKMGTTTRLISARKLAQAQRALRQPVAKRFRSRELGLAGKRAGADYVLSVKLSKKRWRYTASAVLIATKNNAVVMSYETYYFKPRTQAADRATRIADKVIEKLRSLHSDESPEVAPVVPIDEIPSTEVAGTSAQETMPKLDEPPSASAEITAIAPPSDAIEDDDRDREPPPPQGEASPSPYMFRLSLGPGSTLVRSYGLSSKDLPGERSVLSHNTNILMLFRGEAELRTSFGFVAAIQANYRLVRYQLLHMGQEKRPRGQLLTADLRLGYRLGDDNIAITPYLGGRYDTQSVDSHPGDIVLSQNWLNLMAGGELLYRLSSSVDLGARLYLGIIPSFKEKPATTGAPKTGLALGFDAIARYWITDNFGLNVDAQLRKESIGFSGAPTRFRIEAEAQASNFAISMFEFQFALSGALRF